MAEGDKKNPMCGKKGGLASLKAFVGIEGVSKGRYLVGGALKNPGRAPTSPFAIGVCGGGEKRRAQSLAKRGT